MAIDYQVLFGGEDYDPCEALRALRPQVMQAKAEGSISAIRFRDRTVEYHRSDAGSLDRLLRELEAECAAKSGKRKRFAITAGARYQR